MALTTLLLDLDDVLRIWSAENDVRAEQATGLARGSIRKSAFAADLISNATSRLLRDLEHLGLLQLLDHVINSSEVGACKPAMMSFRSDATQWPT
jgi:hypothetical protein